MKALTIRQPWASAVALGWKPIENRRWQTHHRGPIAIHAGVGVGNRAEFDGAVARVADLSGRTEEVVRALTQVRGAIIAVADLEEVCGDSLWQGQLSPLQCDCGPWAFSQSRHFRLGNARRLVNPIPAKGALNLWNVPAEARALMLAEVA